MDKTPEQLAEEHWAWLINLLEEFGHRIFCDGFVHGFKHGQEEKKDA